MCIRKKTQVNKFSLKFKFSKNTSTPIVWSPFLISFSILGSSLDKSSILYSIYVPSHPSWPRSQLTDSVLSTKNQTHPRTTCINDEIKVEDTKPTSPRSSAKGWTRTRHSVSTENERRSSKDGGKRGEEEEVAQLPSATGDSKPTWGPIKGATRGPIYSEERPRGLVEWIRKCQPDGRVVRSLKYRLLPVPLPKSWGYSNVSRYLVFSSGHSLLFYSRDGASLSFRCSR